MSKPNNGRNVSVIGAGNMGSALAEALLVAGHNVTVWNRTEAKCEPLKDQGADVAATALDAVTASDVVVICVLDGEASVSILTGTGMDAALQGKTVLQFTSLEPSAAQMEDKMIRACGARYLEGAILGFPADIRSGSAQIAFSGVPEVFEAEKGLIDCLAENAVHVGEQPGKASQAALVVYARYYGLTFACLHTAALAKSAGIPIQRLLALTGGDDQWRWMGNVMDQYLLMVDRQDYSTSEVTLEVDAADYDMFLRLCRDLGVDPAHHQVIKDVLSKALAQGLGDKAIPAICDVLAPSPGAAAPIAGV